MSDLVTQIKRKWRRSKFLNSVPCAREVANGATLGAVTGTMFGSIEGARNAFSVSELATRVRVAHAAKLAGRTALVYTGYFTAFHALSCGADHRFGTQGPVVHAGLAVTAALPFVFSQTFRRNSVYLAILVGLDVYRAATKEEKRR
mmetsp:Transcript_18824/g.60008  ORF Transcript_18824/g.60008 Transcript_18824/m.60008 type:complete len:146 (-) Transcript_18824:103-540(-)